MLQLQVPTRSALSTFVWGLTLGVILMFTLEHSNHMNYLHRYIRAGHTTNTVVYRNTDKNRHSRSDTTQEESNRTRILCWIMTNPANMPGRAKSVKDTWGKRCDILLFMSSKADANFPAIGLDVQEGEEKLWHKTRASLEYVYEHHFYDAEWFVKADDDTYMIIENLRYELSKLNPSEPHYIGRYIKARKGHKGYNSGGAGYVFSRETLRRFKKALGDPSCPQHHPKEDVAVGICLKAQGVRPVSTRDSSDKETFIPIPLELHLTAGNVGPESLWLKRNNFPRPYKDGPESCSDYPISFHNIKPAMMHHMEYMVYRVKVRADESNN